MADPNHAPRLANRLWATGLVLALTVAPALAQKSEAEKPRGKVEGGQKAAPKLSASEAQQILKDFQELAASARQEGSPSAKADEPTAEVLKKLGRPAKRVQKTSFDAAALDALIAKTLTESKTQPAKIMGDEEFIRRVSLDVAGKLPTPEQVISFVKSRDKDKRAKLIDQLATSSDFAENLGRYWRDVVRYRATNENLNLVRFPKLEEWLTEQFQKNRPWDEIATDLIGSTGDNAENGATVFQVAHTAQPVEMAGEVSRIFLGVQIQCAQCHDHPNDPWKREQFHEFAAFFAGTRMRRKGMNGQGQAPPSFEVSYQKNGNYSMPDLKEPQKSIPVQPKFFFASQTTVPKTLTPAQKHALAASFVTGQDNPWFAKAFINRVWYNLMGEAFYTPVDDIGPTRTAVAPEALDALAKAWQDTGYDIRWLYRIVLNTATYQREFRPTTTAAGKTPFASNCPTRLRPDQILDSLAQALDMPVDGRNAGPLKGAAAKQAAGAVRKGPNDPRTRFNNLFGVDPSTPNDEIFGTIPQALFMMNSAEISRSIQADKGRVLGEILASSPTPRGALEAMYLKVLARRPTSKEVEVCDHHLRQVGNPREAFEDILWALVNSTEFISRR
jgi:Protein of unknown function (DUF1549)/Protein of unknown function (DUF1553)